jgi:hypothetical protein
VKRWSWALPVAIVAGFLFWHGIWRSPWDSPPRMAAPDRPPPEPQPLEAGKAAKAATHALPPTAGSPPLTAAAQHAMLRDEAAFMQTLRQVDANDPARALALARQGNERFPPGDAAAERGAIIARSLARLGRFSEARGEAERLVHDYPDTRWALEVEAQTGAHPRRNH